MTKFMALKIALVTLVTGLCMTVSPTPSQAYEKYVTARPLLMLGLHWEPVVIPRSGQFHECGNSGEQTLCNRFPELISCTGANVMNPNTCRLVFSTPDGRFVGVSTYGWQNPDLMVMTGYVFLDEKDTTILNQILANKPPTPNKYKEVKPIPAPSQSQVKEEALTYIWTRTALLSKGWLPAPIPRGGQFDQCGSHGERVLCTRFPELVSCVGMGENSNTCRMAFVMPGKTGYFVLSTFGWENPETMVVTGHGLANEEDTKRIDNIIAGKAEFAE